MKLGRGQRDRLQSVVLMYSISRDVYRSLTQIPIDLVQACNLVVDFLMFEQAVGL